MRLLETHENRPRKVYLSPGTSLGVLPGVETVGPRHERGCTWGKVTDLKHNYGCLFLMGQGRRLKTNLDPFNSFVTQYSNTVTLHTEIWRRGQKDVLFPKLKPPEMLDLIGNKRY